MKNEPLMTLAGTSCLQRPRFSPGLLLEDEDLTAGVDYTRDLSRLLFRSLFGCGVICGLRVDAVPTCNDKRVQVTVNCGLALDCAGNPIYVKSSQRIEYDPDCDPLPDCLWVVVCYREQCCRPKDTSCGDDDANAIVQTRVVSGFEIKLYREHPECACSCGGHRDKRMEPNPCSDELPAPPPKKMGQEWDHDHDELPERCRCYERHFCGECACGCGCACVVLGVVHVAKGIVANDKGQHYDVDGDVVRRIRPVLRGYMECFEWPTHARGTRIPAEGSHDPPTKLSGRSRRGRNPAPHRDDTTADAMESGGE